VDGCWIVLQPTPAGSLRKALEEHLEIVHRYEPKVRDTLVEVAFRPSFRKAKAKQT
jgi:hypothetical protein